MRYLVTAVTKDTVTIWDQVTKDPDHPSHPAGLMTWEFKDHDYEVGDIVELVMRKVA